MEFHNREKELKRLMKIAEFEPHTIYFIFGPINSGKTALIQEFIRRLGKDYVVFYVNLRGKFITDYQDFTRILFKFEKRKREEILKEILKTTTRFLSTRGIPVSEGTIDLILAKRKTEDVFEFIEDYISDIAKEKRPIFILDELQVIKDIEIDGKLIYKLFNLFVRLTKELHICHVFCLTSDSLFVERIYSEAMLQGRADYMLVDDFDYETTVGFLRKYSFDDEEIDLAWNYFGGKPVYLIKAIENKDTLEEFCEDSLEIRCGQILDGLYKLKKRDEKTFKLVLDLFETIKEDGVKYKSLNDALEWCIDKNILFANPIKRVVKPQSKLEYLAIKKVLDDLS
ncbi:MAG: ATP-binding protein [Archaeoglobaceae archaeon]|nr:ATP-binding protein [Archaeoglobaceae archaeon]